MSDPHDVRGALSDRDLTPDIHVSYDLVLRNPKVGSKWLAQSYEIPWWLPQDRGREFGLILRNALREHGFDVHLRQTSKVVDFIGNDPESNP